MKKIYQLGWTMVSSLLFLSSCKKFIEVSPPLNAISSDNVFINDQTAISVLTGLYSDIGQGVDNPGYFVGNFGLSLILGTSADELTVYNSLANYVAFYTNTLAAQGYGKEYWPPLHKFVFKCNAALEGLNDPAADALTPSIRKQLLGEAHFMRAFFYFYLVNLYGDQPMALTTDYKENTLLSRSPQTKVYQQIIADLKEARDLLTTNYLDATLLKTTTERVRPTQWAARAMLARIYLYTGDFTNAELEASAIIDNNSLYGLPPLNEAFLKNSREAIWQVQPTSPFFNTDDARAFVLPPTGPTGDVSNPVYLSKFLLDSFETSDQRKKIGNWIGEVNVAGTTYYYPYKYKANTLNPDIIPATGTAFMTEYQMVLRLGEQYLIRAEARIRQGKIAEGIEDLNTLRLRATDISLPDNDPGRLPALSSSLSPADALKAVYHERQVELFTEWGHRWFDLKRTGNIDSVMEVITPLKSNGIAEWHSYQQFFPLPQSDLTKAPNLVQNPGY